MKMQDVEGSAELGDITRFLNIIIIMVFMILLFYNIGLTQYKQTGKGCPTIFEDIQGVFGFFTALQNKFQLF